MNRTRLFHLVSAVLFAAIVYGMTVAGLRVRRWTWEQTASIHYKTDMDNAWNWGTRAAREGYLTLYDRVIVQTTDENYGLDYVPLRLGVMTLWARWAAVHFPRVHAWRNDYDLNAPLLRFNAFMEFAGAVGMFFLVRQWIRNERQPRPPGPVRRIAQFLERWKERRVGSQVLSPEIAGPLGSIELVEQLAAHGAEDRGATLAVQSYAVAPRAIASMFSRSREKFASVPFCHGHWLALLAAALVWFNPAAIFSSFGRPTWDVWVIPFYIWAIFFASRNNWCIAGALVGLGAMLKGQQLVVAPFFLLWPIFSLRFGAAFRWAIGFSLAAGAVVSPWLLWHAPSWGPILLCTSAVLVGPIGWGIARLFNRRRFARVRRAVWISGFCLAVALWCTPALFTVSMGWMKLGFIYGVEKMPNLESGQPSSVAAVLQHRYSWQYDDPTYAFPFTSSVMTMTTLLEVIGYTLIALCATAAVLNGWRRDRRFLLAVAGPWVVYFTIFPMMHERYLLWGAVISAAAVAVDWGALGLHVLMTAFAWIMEMDQMLRDGRSSQFATGISPTFGRSLMLFTHGTIPDSAWAIGLICLAWLYLMFAAKSRRNFQNPVMNDD